MKNLTSKVFVIIGPGGIGGVIAKAFNKAGASVVLASRTESKLNALKQEMGGGDKILVVPTDTSTALGAEKVFSQTLQHYGHVDGIVLAAGTWHELGLGNSAVEAEAQATKDITALVWANYYPAFVAAKHFSQVGNGFIANISSHIVTKPHLPGNDFYGPAKMFISHYMDRLRIELAGKARVTDIRPAIVNTPENTGRLNTPELKAKAVQPEEIANWIVEHSDDPNVAPHILFDTDLVLS